MDEDEIREHLSWTQTSPVYLDFSKAFTLSYILIDNDEIWAR